MALTGDLRHFTTTQLFNLINLARKTGALTVKQDGALVRMYFREGKLIHAALEGKGEDGHLTDILLSAGKITPEQRDIVLSRAQLRTDKELGLLLMSSGYATQEEIVTSVREHMLAVVFRLFTWSEGQFRFEPSVQPPDDAITLSLDLENIILEGSRRIHESEQLQEELPDLDGVGLRFTQRPGSQLRRISLTEDEWRVISSISPGKSIRWIGRTCGMDDFRIRKIIYGLMHAGLVELVPLAVEGRPAAVRRPAQSVRSELPSMPAPARPTRGLVRRIIDRLLRL